MIKAESVCFAYQKSKDILNNIAFETESGHCLAILGNNGAGKSTLLRCLNKILKPYSGKIVVCEQDISELKRREIARTVSYVAQHGNIDQCTVFDAILLGRKPYIRIEPTAHDLQIVRDVIQRLGLNGYEMRLLTELSGGEVQKVMLARALAQQPRVLLLDEPTSNLDLKNQHEVMSLAAMIAKEDQMLVIVVIHDLNLAIRYCDRFLFLRDGMVYRYGDEAILTEQTICDVYEVDVRIVDVEGQKIVLANLQK